jgi:hypothetical protein
MKYVGTISLALLLAVTSFRYHAQNASSPAVGARICPDGGGITLKYLPEKTVTMELQVNGSAGICSTGDDGPSVAVAALVGYNIIFRDPS